MKKLLLTTDINGKNTYSITPSSSIVSAHLLQDNEETFTVPTEFKNYQLNFSIDPGFRVWVSFDGTTAEYPPAATFAETNSELNPSCRTVPGGTVVSCITPDTSAMLGVAMYGI